VAIGRDGHCPEGDIASVDHRRTLDAPFSSIYRAFARLFAATSLVHDQETLWAMDRGAL
jgi:hypothetical protein